jgi:type I restriction enzyme S subunit
MESERLRHIADIRVSNVDKKSVEGQVPVRLCNYTDVYYNERITAALEFMESTATPEQCIAFQLAPGDVLLTKDSETPDDIGVTAVVTEAMPRLLCGYHLAMIRPRLGVDGRYLRFALASSPVRTDLGSRANGITRFGLRSSVIGDVTVPLPTLASQRAIADYLDRETARIDALIEKKQRLLELLELRFRVAVVETVGLNGAADRSLGAMAAIALGRQRSPEHDSGPHMIRYLRAANVKDGVLDLSDVKLMNFNPSEQRVFALRQGDILVSEGAGSLSAVGATARWRAELEGMVCFQNTLLRLRPRSGTSADFLAWWCRGAYYAGLFAAIADGANIFHLSAERLRNVRCAIPDLGEQFQTAATLDLEEAKLVGLRRHLNRQLNLLSEKRQALITAAVSGQVSTVGVV